MTLDGLTAEQLSGRYRTVRSFMSSLLHEGATRPLLPRKRRLIVTEGGAESGAADRLNWVKSVIDAGRATRDGCKACLLRAAANGILVGATLRTAAAEVGVHSYVPGMDWFELDGHTPPEWDLTATTKSEGRRRDWIEGTELRRRGLLNADDEGHVKLDLPPAYIRALQGQIAMAGRSEATGKLPSPGGAEVTCCECGNRGAGVSLRLATRYEYMGTPAVHQTGVG